MGAVTSILFAEKYAKELRIDGLILDSPFSCFKTMINDIIRNKVKIPSCLINTVLFFIQKTIKKKTSVNLADIKPIKSV